MPGSRQLQPDLSKNFTNGVKLDAIMGLWGT